MVDLCFHALTQRGDRFRVDDLEDLNAFAHRKGLRPCLTRQGRVAS